jgi:uracil phosphoribosyltransferase
MNVTVPRHPLLLHKLTQLRDRTTPAPMFRVLVHDLTQLLFFEATADLALATCPVETPLAPCEGRRIAERLGVVPILRAGLGMADAILALVPEVQVWHLGLYRDHETHQPVTYYNKLPPTPELDRVFVVDQMLATGGSAVEAITILKRWGMRHIRFLGLIAAPEGVQALTAAHPDVPLTLAAIDGHLDERRYIVPGLGDAGDRQFGTH